MSVNRDMGTIEFECDQCGSCEDFLEEDFAYAWRLAKNNGWRCFLNDEGEWEHRCPDCVGYG